MSLYKYVSPARIDILKAGHIRFTKVDDFNDPFEGNPSCDAIVDEQRLKFFTDVMYGMRKTIMSVAELESSDEKFEDVIEWFIESNNGQAYGEPSKNIYRSIYTSDFQAIGVLSLTEKYDDLLMWSHYAQSHQGFVIQFDEKHEFFNQRDNDSEDFGYLRKVEYSSERPRGAVFIEIDIKEKYLVKGKVWEYEQEWRMLKQLNESDFVIKDKSIHLFSFPPSCITGILFGCRMSYENMRELFRLLTQDERYSHVNTFRAWMDSHKYGLHIAPLSEI